MQFGLQKKNFAIEQTFFLFFFLNNKCTMYLYMCVCLCTYNYCFYVQFACVVYKIKESFIEIKFINIETIACVYETVIP